MKSSPVNTEKLIKKVTPSSSNIDQIKVKTPSIGQKSTPSIKKTTQQDIKVSTETKTSSTSNKSTLIQPIGKSVNPVKKISTNTSDKKNPSRQLDKENEDQRQTQQNLQIQTNKYQFLDVFSEQTIQHILSFLQLRDFSKFATLSQGSRKRIQGILPKLDYKQKFDQLYEYFQNNYDDLQFCHKIIKINKDYLNLINNEQQQIINSLESFEKDKFQSKELFHELLHFCVNQLKKTTKQKQDIIPIILSKGIANIFKDLQYEYVKPPSQNVKIPELPQCNKRNSLLSLIETVQLYLSLQQSNQKQKIDQQLKLIQDYKRYRYFEKYFRVENQFKLKYYRPILCLDKKSNVFNYLNKNNIQIIIKFLTFNEIQTLCNLSKAMNCVVTQGVQCLLDQEYIKKNQALQSVQMSEKEAKAVVYVLHYQTFSEYNSNLISLRTLNLKCYSEIFQALCEVIPSNLKMLQQQLSIKDSDGYYSLYHSIKSANIHKMDALDQILSRYTDTYVEKSLKHDNPNHIPYIIMLQKYLKGLKLYMEINKREEFDQIKERYLAQIYQIDNFIYNYEVITKQNKELLLYFTMKPGKRHQMIRKTAIFTMKLFGANNLLQL